MTAPTDPVGAIELATRIQRRRDFTAHATGFAVGAVLVAVVVGIDTTISVGWLAATTLLAWAIALSFQHFRHVLCGPITTADVAREAHRHTQQPRPKVQEPCAPLG